MTQIILNVNDNSKLEFFMELLNSFDFINVNDIKEQNEEEILGGDRTGCKRDKSCKQRQITKSSGKRITG